MDNNRRASNQDNVEELRRRLEARKAAAARDDMVGGNPQNHGNERTGISHRSRRSTIPLWVKISIPVVVAILVVVAVLMSNIMKRNELRDYIDAMQVIYSDLMGTLSEGTNLIGEADDRGVLTVGSEFRLSIVPRLKAFDDRATAIAPKDKELSELHGMSQNAMTKYADGFTMVRDAFERVEITKVYDALDLLEEGSDLWDQYEQMLSQLAEKRHVDFDGFLYDPSDEQELPKVPESFKITDSALSVYRNSSYPSGYAWDGYVEILNDGTVDISLSNTALRIVTDDGDVFMTETDLILFPAVIQPGERGYICNKFGSELVYEADMTDTIANTYPQVANGEVGLNLRMTADVDLATQSPGNYIVDEDSLDGKGDPIVLTCDITNDSDTEGTDLSVFLVWYADDPNDGDDGRKCMGIASGHIDSLVPHETANVRIGPLELVHSLRNEVLSPYWTVYVF